MNLLIQLKKVTSVFLVAFGLACFGVSPAAQAVNPLPDGDYPGGNTAQEQKPARAGMALQSAQRRATVSESSAGPKRINAPKSARIEILASRQCVGGREIAGFSARQAPTAQEKNLTAPAGLQAGGAGSIAGERPSCL